MTTIIQARQNILKKDLDGQWYSVPENIANSFTNMLEEIQNSEFMSDEWFQANDDFNSIFGSYMRVTDAA